MQLLGDLQLAEWLLQVLPIHVIRHMDVWRFGLPELQMRCHLRAGHLRIRFEENFREKKTCRSGASRIFQPLRTASSFWLSHRWSRWKSTASPEVNKSSHLNLSNQLWKHARCRFSQHPTTEPDSCRIFRASNPMRNGTIEDFAVSKRNQTSKESYTDNPRPKKLCLIYKSLHIHPWNSSFVSLASRIVPPFGLMISERLHDVQDVQEHLGRRQVAGGQRRVVVTSTGFSTRWRVNVEGMTLVKPRSVEGGKTRERHMLSESQGGKTYKSQVDENCWK